MKFRFQRVGRWPDQAQLIEPTGSGYRSGIGGIHPIHIGTDLAMIGTESRGQHDRCGIGTTTTQCGHFSVQAHTLEARDDGNSSLVQCAANAVRGAPLLSRQTSSRSQVS